MKKKISMTITPDLYKKIEGLKNQIPLGKLIKNSVWFEYILQIGYKFVIQELEKGKSLQDVFEESKE